jgi:hypothetical protein
MTAVVRVLPRYWDGRRLLRFLTGLAMLTLAFTTHLHPAAEPVVPPAAVAQAAPPASPAVTAEPAPAARPALPPVTAAIIGPVVALLLVGGFALRLRALRVRVERAPPVA